MSSSLLATPEAQRVLSSLRSLARRADVLSAPYAEVNLPYLVRDDEVRTEIERGRLKLRDCLAKRPVDVLMPPDFDLDDQAVDVARSVGIDTSLSNRTGVPVRSEATDEHGAITLVPRIDAASVGEGRLQGALVVPASDPSWASRVATAASADEVEVVTLERLTEGALRIFVDFPDRETPTERRAGPWCVHGGTSNPSTTSPFRAIPCESGSGPSMPEPSRRLRLRGATRTSVPITKPTTAPPSNPRILPTRLGTRPRRSRLSAARSFFRTAGQSTNHGDQQSELSRSRAINVSSPKVDFPDGTSQIVTVEPPGNSRVEFSAITRSTGTFPILVRLTSPDRTIGSMPRSFPSVHGDQYLGARVDRRWRVLPDRMGRAPSRPETSGGVTEPEIPARSADTTRFWRAAGVMSIGTAVVSHGRVVARCRPDLRPRRYRNPARRHLQLGQHNAEHHLRALPGRDPHRRLHPRTRRSTGARQAILRTATPPSSPLL